MLGDGLSWKERGGRTKNITVHQTAWTLLFRDERERHVFTHPNALSYFIAPQRVQNHACLASGTIPPFVWHQSVAFIDNEMVVPWQSYTGGWVGGGLCRSHLLSQFFIHMQCSCSDHKWSTAKSCQGEGRETPVVFQFSVSLFGISSQGGFVK